MTSHERRILSNHRSFDCLFNSLCGRTSKKRQSPHYWPFARGIHWWSVNSPHKGPVTLKMFPSGDVIMICGDYYLCFVWLLYGTEYQTFIFNDTEITSFWRKIRHWPHLRLSFLANVPNSYTTCTVTVTYCQWYNLLLYWVCVRQRL